MPATGLKEVLASAKAYAGIDVAVALAYILKQGELVPKDLRFEASNLLAALLVDCESAGLVLRSWANEEECLCPWPQLEAKHDSADTKEGVPAGSALLDGLMPRSSDAQIRPVLAGLNENCNNSDSGSTSHGQNAVFLPPVHYMALQCLLAHSFEAKHRTIERQLHLHWVQNAIMAMECLVNDHDQVGAPWPD